MSASASVNPTVASLLVELLVEELPPKALRRLGDSFASTLASSLRAAGVAEAASQATAWATPRRLGVTLTNVTSRAADRAVRTKLMPVAVALDASGAPTPALRKKLASLGLDDAALAGVERAVDGKAEALFLTRNEPGATLAQALQSALDAALAALPIPKVMTYQLADGWSNVHFVRPAHRLVALHGADVVPVRALGLDAGRVTEGHRFEASSPTIELAHADDYASRLASDGAVIASFDARRAEVERQLDAAARGFGLVPLRDDALLDEVTSLVERPNVLACAFEPEFLEVPQECLILTMKANQKYFPLLDAAGKLTHRFLVVSAIRPDDASAIVIGNERVVRPRLADAKFFFDQDRKRTLASRVDGLDKVVYHGKLGSQGARMRRVRAIAHAVVAQWRLGTRPYSADVKDHFDVLDAKVAEAATLAKADLLTDMVGEFPELQGVMGAYYARHEGLRDGVAIAIEDHYKPRFAGDALPRNHTGTALALADKLETLVGLFGVGQQPSGDKDPYALRRHALGVLRLLIEKRLPLALPDLLHAAAQAFDDGVLPDAAASNEKLQAFVFERLAGLLRDAYGASAAEADALIAVRPAWGDLPAHLAAVRAFGALPEAAALAAANKRVGNILRKADVAVPAEVDASRLVEPAERALAQALADVAPRAQQRLDAGDATGSLQALAALRAPVDAFFDTVMVNADDAALKANRLALLAQLHAAMNRVADLSRLAS